MEEINQFQRAALAWNVLINVAKDRDFIQYKDLGRQIGIHPRAVRFVLAVIQDYCLKNHLPPITILIGDENGVPGSGFIAWDILNLEDGKNQVYEYNWELLDNPFGYAIKGVTEEEVITTLLENPEFSGTIYARVKVRGTAQTLFRKALIKAYNSRCAVCGLSFEVALQAAHIIPWSLATSAQRMDVRNGILLCTTHHCLFDNGFLKINDNFMVSIAANLVVRSRYDNLLTGALNNQKLALPAHRHLWPKLEYFQLRK